MYLHVATPSARPMNDAINLAFRSFGCEPLGGASTDGWSGIANLQRCPYRYYLFNEAQAVPVGGSSRSALDIGGLYHAVLACHYGRFLPKGYPGWREVMPPPFDFLDAVDAAGAEAGIVQEVRRIYSAYSVHYETEDVTPVAIEFEAGQKGVHTCRFDMLAWHQGALWNFEHKTAYADTPDAIEGWWLDGEIIGEMYGARISEIHKLFGAPLAGVCINLAFKTTPARFRRVEVILPEAVIERYIRDRQFWAQQRDHFRKQGYWPKALQGCLSRFDRCAFWEHCRDEDNSLVEIRR